MKRILVIDDNDHMREILGCMLKRAKYKVSKASDGEIGLRLQQKNPFDLVITDIVMPNKDGIETILELKENYPDLKVIAISGGDFSVPNHTLETATTVGAIRTLSKPFARKQLLETVEEVLD